MLSAANEKILGQGKKSRWETFTRWGWAGKKKERWGLLWSWVWTSTSFCGLSSKTFLYAVLPTTCCPHVLPTTFPNSNKRIKIQLELRNRWELLSHLSTCLLQQCWIVVFIPLSWLFCWTQRRGISQVPED